MRSPPRAPRTRLFRLLFALLTAVATLLAIGVAFGPSLLENRAKALLIREAERIGVRIALDDLELGWTEAVARGVCAWELAPHDAAPLACVEVLRVRYSRPSAFSTDVRPESLHVHGARIDLSSERGTLEEIGERMQALIPQRSRGQRRPDSAPAAAPPQTADAPDALEVQATSLHVDLSGQPGVPLDAVTSTRVEWTRVGREHSVLGDVSVEGLRLAIPGLSLPTSLRFAAHATGPDDLSVQLDPERPVRYAPSETLEVLVGSASFTMPYYLSVADVSVRHPATPEPAFVSFATATLEIGAIPARVEDLSLVKLEVQSPRLHLELDETGFPTALASLRGAPGSGSSDGEPADDASEPADETAETEDEESNEAPTEPEPDASDAPTDGWSQRIWWEQIPQMIVLHDLQARVVQASDATRRIDVRVPRLEYALRIFNQQLDITWAAEIAQAGEPVGAMDVELMWRWTRSRLSFDIALDDLRVGPILRSFRGGEPPLEATIDLQASYRDWEYPWIETEGSVEVRDLRVDVPLLREPLALPHVAWSWAGRRTPDAEAVEDPVAREPLVFTRGEGTLGDVRFRFTPTLYRFRYNRLPVVRRLGLTFEVPLQDAQTVVDAVPATLLGPVHGMEVSGTWGMEADVEWEAEEREGGGWTMRLREPWTVRYHDESLALRSLPEPVDVRRLNGSMDFVFRGPEDRIQRRIAIPGPAASNHEAVAPDEGTTGTSSTWRRLRDISYYLIAIQLDREDGRFFENSGFNWYQWRRVVQEAIDTRSLGRGASTISMQLVKNVFLSHERSVERKLQELLLTYWLTRTVPKERILEVYLNIIEWGPGVNGVEEASRYYFGKSASALSAAESAWLAAITPAPARRSAQRAMGEPPAWMMRQVRSLLRGVHTRGMISDAELRQGEAERVRFVTHSEHGLDGEPGEGGPSTDEIAEASEPLAEAEETDASATPPRAPRRGERLADLPIERRIERLIARSRPLRGDGR